MSFKDFITTASAVDAGMRSAMDRGGSAYLKLQNDYNRLSASYAAAIKDRQRCEERISELEEETARLRRELEALRSQADRGN